MSSGYAKYNCVGAIKPSAAIYRETERRFGLEPAATVFIDDLPQHHHSVSEVVPHVRRLHLCGEPMLAPLIDCAHQQGHAHARIDCWHEALPWLLDQLHNEEETV